MALSSSDKTLLEQPQTPEPLTMQALPAFLIWIILSASPGWEDSVYWFSLPSTALEQGQPPTPTTTTPQLQRSPK